MGELELRPATELSESELAELFTASYEGHLVPFVVDADAVRVMTETYDLDRAASRVAVRDGARVGLANLAVRARKPGSAGSAWCPPSDAGGTGRVLMLAVQDEARARGATHVWLEVMTENTEAISLYRQLGYQHVRDLEVWSLPGAAGGPHG